MKTFAADGDSPLQKTTPNGHNHQVKEIFYSICFLHSIKLMEIVNFVFGLLLLLLMCCLFLFVLFMQIPDFAYSPNPHSEYSI
jgi:hypothetical protein